MINVMIILGFSGYIQNVLFFMKQHLRYFCMLQPRDSCLQYCSKNYCKHFLRNKQKLVDDAIVKDTKSGFNRQRAKK